MKPYFYVYRENVGQGPTNRHATLELAQAEAERLAVKHTGSVIQILKCVGISQVTGPASTFFMDGELQRHNFLLLQAGKALRDALAFECHKLGDCPREIDEWDALVPALPNVV